MADDAKLTLGNNRSLSERTVLSQGRKRFDVVRPRRFSYYTRIADVLSGLTVASHRRSRVFPPGRRGCLRGPDENTFVRPSSDIFAGQDPNVSTHTDGSVATHAPPGPTGHSVRAVEENRVVRELRVTEA